MYFTIENESDLATPAVIYRELAIMIALKFLIGANNTSRDYFWHFGVLSALQERMKCETWPARFDLAAQYRALFSVLRAVQQ